MITGKFLRGVGGVVRADERGGWGTWWTEDCRWFFGKGQSEIGTHLHRDPNLRHVPDFIIHLIFSGSQQLPAPDIWSALDPLCVARTPPRAGLPLPTFGVYSPHKLPPFFSKFKHHCLGLNNDKSFFYSILKIWFFYAHQDHSHRMRHYIWTWPLTELVLKEGKPWRSRLHTPTMPMRWVDNPPLTHWFNKLVRLVLCIVGCTKWLD